MRTFTFEFPFRIVCDLKTIVSVEAAEMDADFELLNSGTGPYYRVSYAMDERLHGGCLPAKAVYYYYYGPGFPHLLDEFGQKISDPDLGLDEKIMQHIESKLRDNEVLAIA